MGSEEKTKRRLIYFLHIPKTAGTTFTAVLDNAFSDLKKLEAKTWNSVPSLDDFEERLKSGKLLHSYEYIRGHFGYGMGLHTDAAVDYMTLIRNPRERTDSQYRHMLRDPINNNWAGPEMRPSRSARDTLKHQPMRDFFENYQVRYLSRSVDYNKAFMGTEESKRQEMYHDCNGEFIKKARITDLYKAISHVYTMRFFGITEYMAESLLLFAIEYQQIPRRDEHRLMHFKDHIQQRKLVTKRNDNLKLLWMDHVLYQVSRLLFILRFTTKTNRIIGTRRPFVLNLFDGYRKRRYEEAFDLVTAQVAT